MMPDRFKDRCVLVCANMLPDLGENTTVAFIHFFLPVNTHDDFSTNLLQV